MTLRVLCRRCGRESDSSNADKTGLCGLCIVADDVAEVKADYQRIWGRFRRYEKAGVDCGKVKRQLAKLATRLGAKVHARIGRPEQAIAILNAHLAEARDDAERGSGRIVLVRPGDLSERLAKA